MNPNPHEPVPDNSTLDLQAGGAHIEQDPGSEYLITVQADPQYEAVLDLDRLHVLALGVLEAEQIEGPLELGVVITTDDEVQYLNREYLGHDYKTDVISFAMSDGEEQDPGVLQFITPPERPRYLGDIAISYDRAAEQAPDYGHAPDVEVATLLIHGLLHLLGYDDTAEDAREVMHARQDALLARIYMHDA
jgi:probable rRNA maturation factor